MPNNELSFEAVEQMLDELASLASDDDDDNDDSAESSLVSSSSSATASSSYLSVTDSDSSTLAWSNHQHSDTDVEEEPSLLLSVIRQYCCCHFLRLLMQQFSYTTENNPQQEPLLQPEEKGDGMMEATSSSQCPTLGSPKRNAPKRSSSAEERVLALIHQRESATTGNGPKPWDTFQAIVQNKRSVTTCSAKELPSDYWVPWNTDGYSLELTKAVRQGNLSFVQLYARNLQCSNAYGESILHVAARRGDLVLLQYLVEQRHISMRVCCESERNVLHDACWTSRPSFACITWLMDHVPELLLVQDARGRTPLEYAPSDTWDKWNAYLKENPHLVLLSTDRLEKLRRVE
ncbi:hypothetical protein FisN_13Lh365 [Fistulifera solaris]|uniref:Uncharacterized protein n=1 Tax=Fistulifera solaris TaxID=1519565 RepID=A0A1Z5KM35_FISSO|nr:hypothetical protein FisN_13Lh365 [Fistulifera solaris]|eukprot:GAX27091.1 hypothetical protein FisN_13Lh365 [Fistulifera solaris]